MEIALVVLLGFILGSFFNVCIHRIPEGKSVIHPPSYCPKCLKAIKWYDNIPVLGYFLLKGKCRYCNEGISFRYPLIEIATGIIFLLIFLKFGLEKSYFFYIMIMGYMIILTVIDIDKKVVPDSIILFMFITGFIAGLFELKDFNNIFEGIAGALAGGFVMLVLSFFSNSKLGEGDVKLIAALGLWLGFIDVMNLILYAFIIGGIWAFVLIALKKSGPKDEIAFVPFIGAAYVVLVLIK